MVQKISVGARVSSNLDKWLREYAAAHKWSMSQTIAELLEEKRKDIECRELAKQTGGRNDRPIGAESV